MTSTCGERAKDVIIDCSHTRYHVVRAAAQMTGWAVNDAETDEVVPELFYGVALRCPAEVALAHPAEVLWTDKSVLSSRVAALTGYQRLNHFAAMHVIARKAVLFRRLMHLYRLSCQSSKASRDTDADDAGHEADHLLSRFFAFSVPPSFSSLSDLGLLEAFQKQQQAAASSDAASTFFIVKPNTGCEGRGIRLTTSPLAELTDAEKTDKKRECIVQLYVDRPLLMYGKKFDLRLYVLLVSVTPEAAPRPSARASSTGDSAQEASVRATSSTGERGERWLSEVPPGVAGVRLYVHNEGLVRICAEPYAAPTPANCGEAHRHLTNYAVNKSSAHFKPAHLTHTEGAHKEDTISRDGLEGAGESNKESFATLAAYIDAMRVPGGSARVRRRIDECIALTVLSGVEPLRRELIGVGGARGDRADGRGCFELLGFDVLLRQHTLDPVLMEVNHSPSLFCDTAFDFGVKSRVLRDTFRVLETHMPSWDAHKGNPRKYAALTSAGSRSAARMDAAEAALLQPRADDPCGFRPLLPHYGMSDSDGCDWQPEERAAQAFMVEKAKQLR